MADTFTPHYDLNLPDINDNIAVIAGEWNANFSALDTQLYMNAVAAAAAQSAAVAAQTTASESIPESTATAANQVLVSSGIGSWAVLTLASFKSWLSLTAADIGSFASSVIGTVLTGFTTATSAAVIATDTIVAAIGKLQAQINVSASPAGTVTFFANNAPPTGYLECNGALISRTVYSNLFTAVGTTFSAGDGSTTFGIPDLRGGFVRGWDHGAGIDTSRVFGSLQLGTRLAQSGLALTYVSDGDADIAITEADISTAGGYTYPSYRMHPRNVSLLPCIKY